MRGDARVRRCPTCDKNVYNVASLSRREVDRLIRITDGHPPCLRLYRRPDGTIVTRRCFASARRAAGWLWMKAAVLAALLIGFWADVAVAQVRRFRSLGAVAAPAAKDKRPTKKKQPKPQPPPPKEPPKHDLDRPDIGQPLL
jgi:hypothetical protein